MWATEARTCALTLHDLSNRGDRPYLEGAANLEAIRPYLKGAANLGAVSLHDRLQGVMHWRLCSARHDLPNRGDRPYLEGVANLGDMSLHDRLHAQSGRSTLFGRRGQPRGDVLA